MRTAKASLDAILDQETRLHVEYCRDWGIEEEQLLEVPEASATLAYTRYVLESGNAGNLLDLHTALAPCVVGYAEIARWLVEAESTKSEGNPYRSWIDMYASDDYQQVARAQIELLEELSAEETGPRRIAGLEKVFAEATRLEIRFWDMGLHLLD